LNSAKKPPSERSQRRANQSFSAVRGRSSSAHSAGLKLSELKAEITVATAIVIANWR